MAQAGAHYARTSRSVHPDHRADAVNLTHYLALRQADVRSLQRSLGERGLSSLGRCEPHVLATVESVRVGARQLGIRARCHVAQLRGRPGRTRPQHRRPLRPATAGPGATGHGDAARARRRPTTQLVRHLVSSGMDVARINGAHDDPDAWEKMARNVRKASDEVDRPCRISMDLPGPKLRTGPSGRRSARGPAAARA